MTNQIESFLEDLELTNPEQARIVREIRAIWSEQPVETTEKFIYGGIGVFIDGKQVGGSYASKQFISLVFGRGNELNDPEKRLYGKGKYRRKLRLYSAEDLTTFDATNYIQQAIALETAP